MYGVEGHLEGNLPENASATTHVHTVHSTLKIKG